MMRGPLRMALYRGAVALGFVGLGAGINLASPSYAHGNLVHVTAASSYGLNSPEDVSFDDTHVRVRNHDRNSVAKPSAAPLEDQTITFTSTPPTNAVAGGPSYIVSATGGASGNPVVFSVESYESCSISGSTVSFTAPGTCIIEANQAGNDVYAAASPVQQSFNVGIGSQTITFTSTPPTDAIVGGSIYKVSATGGASENDIIFSIDSSATSVCSIGGGFIVSFIGPGTCTLDANQGGNANYAAAPQAQQSFSVIVGGDGPQTITFTSTPPTAGVVGGPTYAVSATGGASGNPVTFSIDSSSTSTCSISGSIVSFIAPGTCTVDANQSGNTVYAAAPQAQQSFLVITGDAFTSNNNTTVTVGESFTFSVTTNGASQLKEVGRLPKGVSFTRGTSSGTLAGTPTSTKHKSVRGTYTLEFRATFESGKGRVLVVQPFTLIVS